MSAADAIHERIHGVGYCNPPCGLCMEVVDLLEGYAHELAEKIRNSSGRYDLTKDSAADLIDPEVST